MAPPARPFDLWPTTIRPLRAWRGADWLPFGTVHIGRARGARPSPRVAFLVHGFAMNEDYFGLLAPLLIGRGYDVWALRLPGYVATGERAGRIWPVHIGSSMALYGLVVASAMAHVARTLRPRPTHFLGWGHSLGGAALASAVAYSGPDWAGPDQLVFEAPAFYEAIGFSRAMVAGFAAFPDGVLNALARGLLLDDIKSSEFATCVSLPFIPGRASRLVLTMNALALVNPFSATKRLAPTFLERSWFVIGDHDRLVDHDRLIAFLDTWNVAADRRLVLLRNHFLSLTSASEMVDWIDGSRRREPTATPRV